MAGEAQLVLLGVQAAIRINAQYRKGFADSVRSNAITLPLPNFNPAPDLATALGFYTSDGLGVEFATSNVRVAALLAIAATGAQSLTGDQRAELLALYRDHSALVRARNGELIGSGDANPAVISNQDAFHLLQIRQWREGQDPNPTMLRRLAGTFIEIGVDYFANYSPLAVAGSAPSKALVAFLRAIEPISFAEGAPQDIVQGLFLATVETVRDNAGLISNDQWAQTLIHDVTAGLYTDAKKFIDASAGDLSRQDRVARWTQLIYRSVLKSAGDSVFNNPATYFKGLDEGQADLVGRVGRAMLGAVITDTGVQLDHLFTPDALDAIAKASFAAVAAHPELVAGGNTRLQTLVGAIASGLSTTPNVASPNFLAEAIRVIIQKTGENLDALMPAGSDPAKNLLLVASKQVLAIVSAPPQAGAVWKLQFGPTQLETLLHTVVAQVASNPGWLVAAAGGANSVLGQVTQAVIGALQTKTGPLLNPETAVLILKAAYDAVGKRLQLASKNAANRPLIGAALDAVFATVFDPAVNAEAKWVLVRDEGIGRLTAIVLAALAKYGATDPLIAKTVDQVNVAIQALGEGRPWTFEGFAVSLDTALAA